MIKKKIFEDQGGYALILTLIFMAILMIGGILSSSSSITDISVTRNSVLHSQNAAVAESAAMTAIQLIENEVNSQNLWPDKATDDFISADPYDSKYSSSYKVVQAKDVVAVNLPELDKRRAGSGNAKYCAIGWSQPRDTSIGQYSDILRECRVIGEYVSSEYGSYRVEMGFKKRF